MEREQEQQTTAFGLQFDKVKKQQDIKPKKKKQDKRVFNPPFTNSGEKRNLNLEIKDITYFLEKNSKNQN